MKKIITFLVCLGISYAFSLSGGYGSMQQQIGGYVKGEKGKNYFGKKNVNPSTDPYTGYFGLADKTHPYFWIKLTHSIPYVPNIKFQYTKYESSGHSDYIAANVKVFGNVNINTIVTNADTYMSIDSYDTTLFYTLKKYGYDIELGAGLDYWHGKFKIYDNTVQKYKINYEGSLMLPYLYAGAESKKKYGLSVLGNVKIAYIGDKHYYDLLGGVKYTINTGYVNPFVKVGYKYKEAYYKDEADNTTTLTYKGIFFEIGAKF